MAFAPLASLELDRERKQERSGWRGGRVAFVEGTRGGDFQPKNRDEAYGSVRETPEAEVSATPADLSRTRTGSAP